MHTRHRIVLAPGPAREPARSDEGAAAVEMAIVLPLLLLILFGIIDMGRLMQQQIQLTEAAREGARLGALNGSAAQVKTKVSGIVGTDVTLTYPTGQPAVCLAASIVGQDSTVVVTRTFAPVTPLWKMMQMYGGSSSPGTVTLKATGVMSCVG
ncbi:MULTISPECIES: TadE/TadG family type IV pilus assembly protein [Actinoplanes]|uniref:TadE/TadG family type IV pilus assembly protein n=1 Tax=Actinoplanes TaxID=1865 RepID=UPI0006970C95|nr:MULTISPECIES: TadE/TadG family type IV pilus assembly protein [Actinoplanes]GLY02631.1 hypothetical protein Acsp01_30100 [Actinoplanes sp. NBRC 101535]